MTWNEIYERAEDTGCGDPRLQAKDEARFQVGQLVKERENIDIEETECPEEEVDYYAEAWNIQFDENGNIIS